ncbi:site-specific integrase [uncultured Desulfovibrio sp.]|uniref:tyrosine-type recombinase/integrase n=1 Tax=uncultured Desulfovibrio sp. TaxID=167968 RepID=UPI002636AB6A|nr:site-specific integrase [uncultured Desulfovibrio sp.]
MAIRERKGRASPWQCYWNNPLTGKRECANFATQQEAEKHDSLIKHRIKFDRESFRQGEGEEEEEQQAQDLTLEACYLAYLKEKNFTKGSLAWQIGAMRYPLQKIGLLSVAKITRKHLEQLKAEMLAMPVKSATIRGRLSVLRTVLRWCVERGFCDPVRFPKLPPAQYEKFVPPTPAELAAIMECAAPHIVRTVILGAQCGVRVGPSELFVLTWDDVDLARKVVHVHGAKKNHSAPWREVPIREGLLPLFRQWWQEDAADGVPYLIHHNGKPVGSIKTAWAQALRRAGITRRIRPYDLRHFFATELIAGGVDIGTVAKLMGHSSPAMILMHYQYVMDGQKRAAVEALPELAHVPKSMCPKEKALTERQ